MNRRDLLAGFGCVAALGGAEYLRPRRTLIRMPEGAKLEDVIPRAIADWTVGEGGDIVVPRSEDSLATQLYNDQLARIYRDATGAHADVMVVAAYGSEQSDSLQLHRPEFCFPAIGFEITSRRFQDVRSAEGWVIPAVALTAQAGSRIEDILYWTRLGDALPRTVSEQRKDRFQAALAGYIGDGLLFRASAIRQDEAPLFDQLATFLSTLVDTVSPQVRVGLLGQRFAA